MKENISKFTVMCNDRQHLQLSIDWYNTTYKTDFEIIDFIFDEVNFAEIQVSKYSLKDIFI